jgi:hypothetical protein
MGMRRIFSWISIFAVLAVVCGGGGFLVLTRNSAELDASSRAYTHQAVIAIAKAWNKDELWKRASPEFKRTTQLDDLNLLFEAANAALGPLYEYEGGEGEAQMAKAIGSSGEVTAHYVAHGRFAKDEAVFDVTLRQIDNRWMIDAFHVRSASLMKRLAQQAR